MMTQLLKKFLGIGVMIGLAAVCSGTLFAQGYNQGYSRYEREQRWPVDATIQHLKNIAAQNTYSGKEMERYDNAMSHLSQFAEKIQRGNFDRGKLDRGIGDVQNVLNKNPMDGRSREILNNDVYELQRLRASYRWGY